MLGRSKPHAYHWFRTIKRIMCPVDVAVVEYYERLAAVSHQHRLEGVSWFPISL